MTTHKPFHQKYRPAKLDKCLGHEAVVTRLKGIVKSNKIPSAIMFSGPSSAGKTTLARALAADINELETIDGSRDYMEQNCTAEGSIDEIRSMLKTSHFRPSGKRRVIVLDEAQGLLRLPASASCLEASTKVLTNKGSIEAAELFNRIKGGEEFLAQSFNHKTGDLEWKPIVGAQRKLSNEASVTIGNQGGLTENHKVYTAENGYTSAVTTEGLTGLVLKTE